jgi:competence protein ComEC
MSISLKKLYLLAVVSLSGFLLNASPGADPAPLPAGSPMKPFTPAGPQKANDLLRVHFIDVGHGDACLIQTPGGHTILIDGGDSGVAGNVADYISKAGVKDIDLVIATHPHSDHVGALPDLLRRFPVNMVLDSGASHTSATYQRFLETIKANKKIQYVIGRAGQAYDFDAVKIYILNPTEPLPDNLNNCSIVSRLVYDNISFLFAGDAEVEAERAIMRRSMNIRSTVLKVGHHGSSTSTCPSFVRAVSPKVAIISCRRKDSGNPPPAESRFNRNWTKVYRTDIDGTIRVESNGKNCIVKMRRQNAHRD